MNDQLVSDSNKEFLEEVSPSKLQQCISKLFRLILARKDDMQMTTWLSKKLKNYSKNINIPLPQKDEDVDDRILEDLKEREKNRIIEEDDILGSFKTLVLV